MPVADRSVPVGDEFEKILADIFRKAGWRVRLHPSAGDMKADLIVEADEKKYVVELKSSSEGRRDRLIPLLSQSILQARAYAHRLPQPMIPLAVVAAPRIASSVADHIKQFAARYAPDVGVGVVDSEGFSSFSGSGLQELSLNSSRRVARHLASPQRLPDLFSDLNQWMLKILLGQRLSEALISVPRKQIRNASQLAEAAEVSIMSASRFVNQLASQGFLDENKEQLQIVRPDELLELWIAANRQAAKEFPARWIIKSGPRQLDSALREYNAPPDSNLTAKRRQPNREILKDAPRCCLALFAAADALGFGFVRGVPPHVYLERLTLGSLSRLGLVVDHSSGSADVYLRIPVRGESVFRASVIRENVRVSDALQVFLDVSVHPARGREQADEIRRRVLKPLFENHR
jgi:hypothetical protein